MMPPSESKEAIDMIKDSASSPMKKKEFLELTDKWVRKIMDSRES